MSPAKLTICVIDNGSTTFLHRTFESIQKQTNQTFSFQVLDCRAFWSSDRNTLAFDADYVLYLYSGSRLEENAVELIRSMIDTSNPAWLYFDEKTYSAEINEDAYGFLDKPDFDVLGFAQEVYTGEGVVFSRKILNGMTLKYEGSNFAAALTEMTIAAAAQADSAHLRECILTRHNKCDLLPDERNLLLDALKEYLKKRKLNLLSIKKPDILGLYLLPLNSTSGSLSIILLSDTELPPDTNDCFNIGENTEVIKLGGEMPYWEKCLLAAQKASKNMLCFLDVSCKPPAKDDFDTLYRYASLPYAGFVSPCIYGHNEIIYAGTFVTAGKPLHVARTEDNMQRLGKDLRKIRQTAIPAWQFWMIKKELYVQIVDSLTKSPVREALSKEHFIMECAFRASALGMKNLYIGSVLVGCEATADNSTAVGFCDMLSRHKASYFLDPYCPINMRNWMRTNGLKGGKAYFPEHIPVCKAGARKVFVLTHELSLTGAPLVLSHAVRTLQEEGFQVVLVSPDDGVLRHAFLKENTPVLILGDMNENDSWLQWVSEFDLVLVNTIVPFRQIEQLGSCPIPVMWWLHDAKSGYENYLQYVLPETLPENTQVFSVSKYADDAVKTYRPKYKTDLLLYGLKDESGQREIAIQMLPGAEGKKLFVNVGTVIHRKGQDILTQAIRLLPEHIRKQCLFLFIGKCIDADIFQYVKQLEQEYPDEVCQIDTVAHDEIFSLYKQASAVICSSRDDPLPTFMAETMMVSGVCICSENTGMVNIIQNGKNGFLYKDNNAMELAQCIQFVVEHGALDSLRAESRKTFEQVFTMDIFKENLMKCVMRCINPTSGGDCE